MAIIMSACESGFYSLFLFIILLFKDVFRLADPYRRSEKMKTLLRLKKNTDFQLVFKKGKSTANRQFVVYVLKFPGRMECRLGLSVSKKVGNAVTRNRIKRKVKEVLRSLDDRLEQGSDYVIIARNPAANMTFAEIESSLQHVLKRAKVLKSSRR